METKYPLLFLLFISCCILNGSTESSNTNDNSKIIVNGEEEPPTVLIVLLVRNKVHVLPLFLTYFENLDYPKSRIALWIRSDHNNDASIELLNLWLNKAAPLYHSVNVSFDDSTSSYQNESSQFDWPLPRFRHVIQLKEKALEHAQQIWAEFLWFLDVDVLLTSPNTLRHLIRLRLPIVAPMLLSEGLYSNFWCAMSSDYYYQSTDEYKKIYSADKVGVFQVPMVHSAVLVHLNYIGSRHLTFDRDRLLYQQRHNIEWAGADKDSECRLYDGPLDDIIIFAISANCSQIPLYVSNEKHFGYILQPLDPYDKIEQDFQQLVNIRTNIVHDLGEITTVEDIFQPYITFPEKQKLSLDHIYMINLERRTERRHKMEQLFNEIGLDVEYFAAVDGKDLNPSELQNLGINMLKGYEDPYQHRQMTMGEIGCFLSHYRIWELIVSKNQKEVLILEDDIRFEPYFRDRARNILSQTREVVDYDLIYFGRKRLKEESEPWVTGTNNLVHVGYSYWTLGYVISLEGARKLLAAKPLQKMLPVDEFLPIMFNRHPNKTWSSAFEERNLIAFSASPLLLFPTHYTGDNGYISDTEDSELTTFDNDNNEQNIMDESDFEMDYKPQSKSNREMEFPSVLRPTGGLELNMKSHEEL